MLCIGINMMLSVNALYSNIEWCNDLRDGQRTIPLPNSTMVAPPLSRGTRGVGITEHLLYNFEKATL